MFEKKLFSKNNIQKPSLYSNRLWIFSFQSPTSLLSIKTEIFFIRFSTTAQERSGKLLTSERIINSLTKISVSVFYMLNVYKKSI